MGEHSDTIAAIATASGAAGVGIVRLSGPHAFAIARSLSDREPRPGGVGHAHFRDSAGESIDDGLLLAFAAPRSYTGEDVIELQAHGSIVLLAALLARCCELGARLARPGEFTERAFLNGKLDLVQAEAVADLIAAGSDAAARAARRSLDGVFSRRCGALAEALSALRMHVEAAIDFPEEEIDFLSAPALRARLDAVQQQLRELLREAQRGQRLRDGLHVVIVGPPNVGKSSLLNALAGSDRAIVTELAGTTRDVLREVVRIDGIEITLVDTAGLRDSEDVIEREGIRRAHHELAKADLALIVSDGAAPVTSELSGVDVARRLYLHNKCDLTAHPPGFAPGREGHLWVSAQTGAGLDALRTALRDAAGQGEGGVGAFSARARHVDALRRANAHLAAARECIEVQRAGELAAEELRLAHLAVGEITGQVSADDLLGQIFAGFCIGK
ncbi:MAG: tRNA uridine-5-carboxymethylaminomethyl(34) synthesis GTPase MnmE [Gammaproteobacteria bacterium HGW-Gammaproteobacteria-4]|jgi:tRNA modification GTPase|nr:MAG: tRNA uridine-5-carboxymethylaminomethyl(34) synthesis GTPase MnmE [Gammaproteobacteria bacterium HGW-Gammaproteobacteria-4]